MFMWMSSSSRRKAKRPLSSSARTASRPLSMAARSAPSMSPARSSARAHAALPRMSWGQSRRSKASEDVKASAVGSAPAVEAAAPGLARARGAVSKGHEAPALAALGRRGPVGVEQRGDVAHDPPRDLLAVGVARAAAARLVEVQRLAEADGERAAAGDVEAAAGQRLVGAADRRGHDGHARAQRDHGDARLPRYEPPLAAERPLGEDPDDAAVLEDAEGALDGARVWALEVDGDGAERSGGTAGAAGSRGRRAA